MRNRSDDLHGILREAPVSMQTSLLNQANYDRFHEKIPYLQDFYERHSVLSFMDFCGGRRLAAMERGAT